MGAIAGGVSTVLGMNTYVDGMTGTNVLNESLQAVGVPEGAATFSLNVIDTGTVLINPGRKGVNSLFQLDGAGFHASKADDFLDMIWIGNNGFQHQEKMQ